MITPNPQNPRQDFSKTDLTIYMYYVDNLKILCCHFLCIGFSLGYKKNCKQYNICGTGFSFCKPVLRFGEFSGILIILYDKLRESCWKFAQMHTLQIYESKSLPALGKKPLLIIFMRLDSKCHRK